MTWLVVDVEADGPAPGSDLYSMVSFGAVVVEPGLKRTFKGFTRPISDRWLPDALAVSSITREQHEAYADPAETMISFSQWVFAQTGGERATLISDNLGFDWMFITWYLHRYTGGTPFGFSGRRLNDLFAGWKGNANATQGWKKWRKTKHTHDPVDDATGMAEALLEMKRRGLRIDAIPEPELVLYGEPGHPRQPSCPHMERGIYICKDASCRAWYNDV